MVVAGPRRANDDAVTQKPIRINCSPAANRVTGENERTIEYASPFGDGEIVFRIADGTLIVEPLPPRGNVVIVSEAVDRLVDLAAAWEDIRTAATDAEMTALLDQIRAVVTAFCV